MVTLREVAGDPEELAALQRIMESDEGFAPRVTGHPPGPADAQSTLMSIPEGSSPDDKAPFGVWDGGELVGLLPRWPWARRLRLSVVRPWRYDKLESEAILMDKVITARRGGGPAPTGGRRGGAR